MLYEVSRYSSESVQGFCVSWLEIVFAVDWEEQLCYPFELHVCFLIYVKRLLSVSCLSCGRENPIMDDRLLKSLRTLY